VYVEILCAILMPFIAQKDPESHRFTQDNGPNHTSQLTKIFLKSVMPFGFNAIFPCHFKLDLCWSMGGTDTISSKKLHLF